jgi:hypothetical protein
MTNTPQVIALQALIGPAPIKVHSGNRGEVRKWCRAVGVASLVVEKLTTAELASAYNDTQALADLIMQTPPPRVRPAATLPLDHEQLAAMIRLAVSDVLAELRAVQGEPVTETRVRELIAESVGRKVR